MADLKIYHNPACSTSRNVLELIREHGFEPTIIQYLKTPLDRAALVALIQKTGASVRDILRERGTPYTELDLGNPKWSDDELIDFIVEHPILLNRPIVENDHRAKLCRPIETVLELLPTSAGQ